MDKNGLPWDARIHAGTRTKNKDNTWKLKRGVEPEEVERVTAEYRAFAANNGSLPPQAQPQVQQPPALSPFQTFMMLVGKNMATATNPTGKIPEATFNTLLQQFGVPNPAALATPEGAALIPTLQQQLESMFGAL